MVASCEILMGWQYTGQPSTILHQPHIMSATYVGYLCVDSTWQYSL